MTADAGAPPTEDDWMMLDEACRVASREKIAAWCRDGLVSSRTGLRVSRIRDLDTGVNDTITQENVVLDPADWALNALGNPRDQHWRGEEARFEFGENPGLPFGLNMVLLGGAIYRIQVNRRDLNRMLANAPSKKRAGRPLGVGGYEQSDKPIVERMRADLASGKFKSPYEAGLHFAGEAEGKNTKPESIAKRLASRL